VENDIPSAPGTSAAAGAPQPRKKPAFRGSRDGNASSYTSKNEAKTVKRLDEFAASGTVPDYKNYEQLRRYVNQQGKIMPRRRTGLSAKNQRLLADAIKRARILALLPMPGAPRP
jgi:small subunit ribosomal protein S18